MNEQKFTKTEVINLVRAQLVKTYGGLSQDRDGNVLDTPYTVLGIVGSALPEPGVCSNANINTGKIVRERDTYCGE